MKLDDRGADLDRRVDRLARWFNEKRHPDPGARQFRRERPQKIVTANHVKAAFGGAFSPLLRHEAGRMRLGLQGDVEHLIGRRHLEIKRPVDRGLDPSHVLVADMAAILAQMGGDSIGPRLDREERGAERIGDRAAARVAKRRDMIDIDAEA